MGEGGGGAEDDGVEEGRGGEIDGFSLFSPL